MLNAIEQRIDAEFNGSPDQLLQLRVTVGDAYKQPRRDRPRAARATSAPSTKAAPHLPPDDLLLLTARVRAADHNLIVSTSAAEQLDAALPVLRRLGPPAAELLIDALLHRHVLAERYGVPAHLPPPQRLDALREADAIARRHFGAGSPQHLRVARHLADLTGGMEGYEQGRSVLESALALALARGGDASSGVEYLQARSDLAVMLCYRTDRPEGGRAILAPIVESVRASHGASSALLEELLVAEMHCTGDPRERTARIAEAFEIAAARESAPSMARLRHALLGYDSAVGARNDSQAEGYYRHVQENLEAIPELALRERLTLGARVGRVCQLAKRGDAEDAEALGAPLLAEFMADHARRRRSTPLAMGTVVCLSDARRHLGRPEAAITDLKAVLEMCRSAPPVWARGCAARPYAALALVLLDLGRLDEARDAVQRRLELVRDYGGEPRASPSVTAAC